MNSCKTIISLLLRNKFLFFCSLALFHFWANLKPCKKVYFIIHFHSNSNHNVCFIYVKAYSSLYSSTASFRWRIFTGKHLTSLSCLFFASHTFALEITSLKKSSLCGALYFANALQLILWKTFKCHAWFSHAWLLMNL